MNFQIHALDAERFQQMFQLSDAELQARKAKRMTVAECPGTPCRVSLQDAEVGETVILLNHAHQPEDSPYQATHAIFVRESAQTAKPTVNEIPEVLRSRLISLRLFDDTHMMIGAEVAPGTGLAELISRTFDDDAVAYIHLHYAKPGCFAARVTRAT